METFNFSYDYCSNLNTVFESNQHAIIINVIVLAHTTFVQGIIIILVFVCK